jgi:VWFA-related protein
MKGSRGFLAFFLLIATGSLRTPAQAPTGPMTPQPGAPIQQPPPQQNKIITRVELVNTPVTVRNGHGQMVNTLDAKDFKITDNGTLQQITHFDLGGDALSVVFLVETSARIAPLMPQIQKTGIVLAEQVMGPDGEAAVVGFHDSVDKLEDFTTNQDAIEKTVNKLRVGMGSSKLYDAMAVGVEMLSGRALATAGTPGRRRVMIIVSEAQDVGSETKLGAVLRQAQLSNVTIYAVGLSTTKAELTRPPQDVGHRSAPPGTIKQPPMPGTVQTPDTDAAREGAGNLLALAVWAVSHVNNKITDHALELAATATGGEHIATFKNKSIEKAIDDIGGELHSQYSLSYTPMGKGEIGYHEIKVTVAKQGLKVRARPGYYLAGPES